jgi:hypothetical protein
LSTYPVDSGHEDFTATFAAILSFQGRALQCELTKADLELDPERGEDSIIPSGRAIR